MANWDTNGSPKERFEDVHQQNHTPFKEFQEAKRDDLLGSLGITETVKHIRDKWEAILNEEHRQKEELINKVEIINYSKDKVEFKIWDKKYVITCTDEIRNELENTEHFVDKRYVEILNETGLTPAELEIIIRYVVNAPYVPFKEKQQDSSKYFFQTDRYRLDDKRGKAELLMKLSE